MSDLHSEFVEPCHFEPSKYFDFTKSGDTSNDILCLAGDICVVNHDNLEKILNFAVSKFYRVLYTPGNHEYYGTSIEEGNRILTAICYKYGVIFMNNNTFSISNFGQDIIFIGTPLWSYIPPEMEKPISGYLNDYKLIKGWTPSRSSKEFVKNYNWLSEMISLNKSRTVIVITHHAPLTIGTSDPIHDESDTNCGFATDCRALMDKGVDQWIFGHTHYNTDISYNNTKVSSNQYGYDIKGDSHFNPTKCINI